MASGRSDLRNDPAPEGKIDWQAVEQKFQSWDYKTQGLTEAGAALVTLLAAAVTGPATGVASNISGGVSAGLGVTGNAAMEAAISAGVKSLIGKSSVALVNNQGDLAAALEELGSSSNLRSLATNMVTAGLVTHVMNTLEVPEISPGASVAENMAVAAKRGVIEASIRVGAEAAFGAGAELLGRSRCGRGW